MNQRVRFRLFGLALLALATASVALLSTPMLANAALPPAESPAPVARLTCPAATKTRGTHANSMRRMAFMTPPYLNFLFASVTHPRRRKLRVREGALGTTHLPCIGQIRFDSPRRFST